MATQSTTTPDKDTQRRLPCFYQGDDVAPSFGALQVVGIKVDAVDGTLFVVVDCPSEDDNKLIVFNGAACIQSNSYGEIQSDFPALGLYDTADGDPATDDDYGSQVGSFYLKKGNIGFKARAWVGDPPDIEDVVVFDQEVCRT